MMKNILSCSSHCYSRYSFDRALAGIVRAGLQYVEVAAVPGHTEHVKPEAMDRKQMREAGRHIRSFGLEISGISGHCNLASSEGTGLFLKRIEFAYENEVKYVISAEGMIKSEGDKDNFFYNMENIASQAGRRGITVCLETHGGILGNADECKKTLERIGSEHVKLNYDPANLIYFEGRRPERDMAKAIAHIGYFHIKDKLEGKGVWNFPAIGDGNIDFKMLLGKLYKNRYDGPLSFEIEFTEKGSGSPEEVDLAVAKSTAYINNVLRKTV